MKHGGVLSGFASLRLGLCGKLKNPVYSILRFHGLIVYLGPLESSALGIDGVSIRSRQGLRLVARSSLVS